MLNPTGCVEIPLGVFGGVNLDLGATDLPSGLSPACSDVAFLPGAVFTRPGLKRFSTLGTTAQVIYATTYVKPDGTEVQFQATSDGRMYANGVQIGQTQAGNRFFAHTAFGKLYIAISDGLHGVDVPLQYTPEGWLDRVSQDGPAAPPAAANLVIPASTLQQLTRSSGVVTASTGSAHGLKPGNQVAITGVSDQVVGGTITNIDNTVRPGTAIVTMSAPHGLIPQDEVTFNDVRNASLSITNFNYSNGIVEITTNAAHGLTTGQVVLTQIGSGGGLGPTSVLSVQSPTMFSTTTGAPGANSGSGGQVQFPFPPSQGVPSPVPVLSIPSPTTFAIALDYAAVTWQQGTVTLAWDGMPYVATVPSSTTFTYLQPGPDGVSGSGTITPQGQIAPGARGVVCLFQTRTDFITAPSPTLTWIGDGGQYASITNIPIGPANVIARIIAFTGAGGEDYFFLPIAPRDPTGGFLVGTSTVVADNTSTSAVFDFSDDALFRGTGIGPENTPGNNLFRQVILRPPVAFGSYAGRLIAWGMRNHVTNLLNMGFEGGYTTPNQPLGWKVTGSGTLGAGDYGMAWIPNSGATLAQSVYQDQVGVAIVLPNTKYTFRAWTAGTVTATISSASTGFMATATVTAASAFGQAAFSATMPAVIPPDMTLTLSGSGAVDELELFYSDNPYIKYARVSYVANPEAFDGETGQLGALDNKLPVVGIQERRDILSVLTAGPDGSLYESEDTASGEPATWNFRHVASKCGLSSVWGLARFEDWFCWISDTGLRIYDGGTVDKMSQEVQPVWDGINPQAKQFCVLRNDPNTRRLYMLLPSGAAVVPNETWVMDYRELNSAGALSSAGTLRVGYTGKVVTTDLTRKWTSWSFAANYCEVLTHDGTAVMAFCGGTGVAVTDSWFSTVYTLDEGVIAGLDADYGPFWQKSFYNTYFFISADEAQQKQLGTHRLKHHFCTLNVTGVGSVYLVPHVNRVGNLGRATRAVPVSLNLARDRQFGLESLGDRVSYHIACQPTAVTIGPQSPYAGFAVSSLTLALTTAAWSPVAGWNKVDV